MHKFIFKFKLFSLGFIFGIISKQDNEIKKEQLPKNCSFSIENNIAFAAHEEDISHEGDLKVVANSRLDYREELAKKLELDFEVLDGFSDALIILRSYKKWGESCVDHLLGDFAFAIMDQKKKVLFCARDHMGCRPFYYYEDEKYFLFSSNLKGFETTPEVNFLPSEKYLLHIFNSKVLPAESTFYLGMKRLVPAHSMLYRVESGPHIMQYWDLEINSDFSNLSYEEALKLYKKLLKDAVAQRVKNVPSIGLELSGGLDSSAIAALSEKVKKEGANIHAFSNALSVENQKQFYPFSDETEFAKKAVDHIGIDAFHMIEGEKMNPSLKAIARAVEITHSPLFQLFAAFSDQLLEKVKEQNVHLLLSGFGGDECASHIARGILNEYAEKGEWKKIGRTLEGKSAFKKLEEYVKLILEHLVFKGSSNMIKRLLSKRQNRYRFSDLAMGDAFKEPFMKLERKRKDERNKPEYRIREQQRSRLMHLNLSDRLENSYFQAQQRNIEYAYPLLDVKLLRLVYSLPADYNYRNGIGRYLMRDAMKDLLPDEIRLRNNKFGAAVPNIFYRLHLDQDEYLKLIDEAEQNNEFHYLDYDKLRWQIEKLMDQKNFIKLSFGPRIFFSSISLLLLQKWKREGKMKTGIKC